MRERYISKGALKSIKLLIRVVSVISLSEMTLANLEALLDGEILAYGRINLDSQKIIVSEQIHDLVAEFCRKS